MGSITVLVKHGTPREQVKEQNRTGRVATAAFFSRVKGPCLTRTLIEQTNTHTAPRTHPQVGVRRQRHAVRERLIIERLVERRGLRGQRRQQCMLRIRQAQNGHSVFGREGGRLHVSAGGGRLLDLRTDDGDGHAHAEAVEGPVGRWRRRRRRRRRRRGWWGRWWWRRRRVERGSGGGGRLGGRASGG